MAENNKILIFIIMPVFPLPYVLIVEQTVEKASSGN
jgi:hypothetical protein